MSELYDIDICALDEVNYLSDEVWFFETDGINRLESVPEAHTLPEIILLAGYHIYDCKLTPRAVSFAKDLNVADYVDGFDFTIEVDILSNSANTKEFINSLKYKRFTFVINRQTLEENYYECIGFEIGLKMVKAQSASGSERKGTWRLTFGGNNEGLENNAGYHLTEWEPGQYIAPARFDGTAYTFDSTAITFDNKT